MKYSFFCCLLFLSVQLVHAQNIRSSWAYHWGNAEPAIAPSLSLDTQVNVIVAGSFKGTMDLNPGPELNVFTSAFGGFGTDSYVSKFDSSGNFMWVKTWFSTGIFTASKVIADDDDHILFTGYYSGISDFDPGPGNTTLSSTNFKDDLYIVKLDANGQFQWAISSQGNGNKYVNALTLDQDGNILVAGIFTGTADFDPGPGITSFTSTGMLADLFFAKYDPDGNLLWAKASLGTVQGSIADVAVDSENNIYFGGAFDDRRDFDPGLDSTVLMASGLWDAFLLKFNSAGTFQWVRQLGNDNDNWIHSLVINTDDEIYAAGHFGGTLDFDPGTGQTILSAINTDPFVWKLDKHGNLIWIDQFEGPSFDQALSIELDTLENIYVAGFYAETVDFDAGPGHYNLTSTGNNDFNDVFVVRLTAEGKLTWAYTAGGIGDDAARDIKLDQKGSIYGTGLFAGTAGFYPEHSGADSLISAGVTDVFLFRWTQCLETKSFQDIIACTSEFISPSGNYTWTEDGTYLDTLQNVAGCDSLLQIHLTFSNLNTTVAILSGTTPYLHAEEANATYQWVDCNLGYALLPGETAQDLHTTLSGEYAVILISGDCRDTSTCVSLITSVQDEFGESRVALYPNPTDQNFHLEFQKEAGPLALEIYDAYGRMVFSKSYSAARQFYVTTNLAPGVYLVRLQMSDSERWMRVMLNP